MSAVFGIINKNGKPVEQQTIDRAMSAIAHHAADGKKILQRQNIAFGFLKLIVHPNQINEQLPAESGDIVLTADARIDNRDQLVDLLSLDKQQWINEPDSYLILKAYEKWGEKCVDHLDGEYVVAIWNGVSQQLVLLTDHIGFRPVFYHDDEDQFIFCSEIKGVVAAKSTPNFFSEEHLIEHHFWKNDQSQTYNQDVFALRGGSTLTLLDNKIRINKYWTLQNRGIYNFKKDDEWLSCLRELLYKAIEKRLNYDVPIGITLSGGLDSTAIACILSDLLAKKNKPLYAFSSVLPLNHNGIEEDERRYIEIVNNYCPNIIQTFVEAKDAGPFIDVEDAFEKDGKIPNPFFYMDQAILAAAGEKHIKRLFTGFGGDFWISWNGGTVIYELVKRGRLKLAVSMLKKLAATTGASVRWTIHTEYIRHTAAWQTGRKLVRRKKINPATETALKKEFADKYISKLDFPEFTTPADTMPGYINNGNLGRILSVYCNRNANYGMSSENPFFDKDVIEFLNEAPLHLFLKNGYNRGLLRHAMEGIIPREIQWRKDKTPYSPDFPARTLQGKDSILEMISSNEYAFIFENYLSKEIILKHFDNIKPYKGFISKTSSLNVRVMQAGIIGKILLYLKQNNYQFCKVTK
jgi:asparagine synthase (glutamine-hydrolysing)